MARFLFICLACLLFASPALAAEARAHLTIEIADDGYVTVKQKWDGLYSLERLEYDTGTDELGVLEAVVYEGHSELQYSSSELLRRDGDRLRLVIARLDYLGNWLDFDVSVLYPASLEFINSDPEPSFLSGEAHGLMWSLPDRRELILVASFTGQLSSGSRGAASSSMSEEELRRLMDARLAELSIDSGNTSEVSRNADNGGPDVSRASDSNGSDNSSDTPPASASANEGSRMLRPGPDGGPEPSGQSGSLSSLPAGELLLDGDPLLFEFRMLINAAQREGKADSDFLLALSKLLNKFYYLLDALDATDEYEP